MYVTKYVANTEYNQTSVLDYADYMEKESLIQETLQGATSRQLSAYLDKQNDVVRVEGREYFFNGLGSTYDSEDVTKAIDSNVRGLKKSEARYYTFSISPSQQEIRHLRRMISDTQSALRDSGEHLPESYSDDMMRNYLKDYGVKCMDAYAQNFNHPKIESNRDLLWFGMVEKDRYWKKKDKEVWNNTQIDKQVSRLKKQLGKSEHKDKELRQKIAALETQYIRECDVRPGGCKEILRPMMAKSGDNWHIHVTVSRRDMTNSFNLSPNANSRGGKNHQLNGESVRVGFDRESYKMSCEKIFDNTFSHQRLQSESYEKAKALRSQSAFVFEKQRLSDQATRRAAEVEFAQLKAAGYKDYYQNLLESERLDTRHLAQLKGYIVRQIKHMNPSVNTELLMKQDLSELQEQFGQLEDNADPSMRIDGIASGVGDKMLHEIGLPVYRPISTVRKVLRKGIALNQAIDLRRQVYDQWYGIYSDNWHRENYLFDSIAEHRDRECFFAQTEYLESEYGESVVLHNAQDHLAKIERQLTNDFFQEHWADRAQDIASNYAVEAFGVDGALVRTLRELNSMARERLLSLDATRCMQEAALRCEQPQDIASLREQIATIQPAKADALTSRLETFVAERGQVVEAVAGILRDQNLTNAAKEEALLRLTADLKSLQREFGALLKPEEAVALSQKIKEFSAERSGVVAAIAEQLKGERLSEQAKEALLARLTREGKALNNSLRDLRTGLVKILEQRNPGMKYGPLKKSLDELFKETLKDVKIHRQAELAQVMDQHLRQMLPDYSPIIEKQSELEQLIKEITPDKEKYTERLIEINNRVSQQVNPYAEQLFERHSERLFGSEVRLRNEHDICAYIDKHYTGQQAEQLKGSFNKLYVKIEQHRQQVIQGVVRELPSEELAAIRRQQNHINRYINRNFSPEAAKSRKEELQQVMAAACRRLVTPEVQYKVLDHFIQQKISAQAMQKASQVKIAIVSPQQLMIKAAFKLVNVLTKGY